MLILGIDTSTENCSVGLVRDGKIIAEKSDLQRNIHSEKMIQFIDGLFGDSLSFDDVDAIAVSIGPGSYTGLRIGLSTAKGLALPKRLPVLPVSTLAVLSEVARHRANSDSLVFIKSHKDVIYCSLLQPGSETDIEVEIQHSTFDEALKLFPGITTVFGNSPFPDAGVEFHETYPTGAATALLGYQNYSRLKDTPSAKLEPQYLSTFKAVKWQPEII